MSCATRRLKCSRLNETHWKFINHARGGENLRRFLTDDLKFIAELMTSREREVLICPVWEILSAFLLYPTVVIKSPFISSPDHGATEKWMQTVYSHRFFNPGATGFKTLPLRIESSNCSRGVALRFRGANFLSVACYVNNQSENRRKRLVEWFDTTRKTCRW